MGFNHKPKATYVGMRPDSIGPALDPPLRIDMSGSTNVGVRKDSFSPALDPPSRFPTAGAHALDSLSNFPAAGVQCPRCRSHLTDYDTEANFSAHRTEPLCIRCSGSSPTITPPSTYPPASPVGPDPNHAPPPANMNRGQPAEVRYKQDKDERCGCVML